MWSVAALVPAAQPQRRQVRFRCLLVREMPHSTQYVCLGAGYWSSTWQGISPDPWCTAGPRCGSQPDCWRQFLSPPAIAKRPSIGHSRQLTRHCRRHVKPEVPCRMSKCCGLQQFGAGGRRWGGGGGGGGIVAGDSGTCWCGRHGLIWYWGNFVTFVTEAAPSILMPVAPCSPDAACLVQRRQAAATLQLCCHLQHCPSLKSQLPAIATVLLRCPPRQKILLQLRDQLLLLRPLKCELLHLPLQLPHGCCAGLQLIAQTRDLCSQLPVARLQRR